METKLCRGTENWQTLRENLYLTFDQSEYPLVDDALELLHIRVADDPLPISIQTDWTAQTENPKECYNFTIEEDDDPRNINILESEGSRAVAGPTLYCQEITEKLKIKKVNAEDCIHGKLLG